MRLHLKSQPRDNGRINVMLDDSFFCPLSLSKVASLSLRAGEIEDQNFLSDLLLISLTEQFYHTGLRRLARRPHSTKELEIKLIQYRRLKYDKKTARLLQSETELASTIDEARQSALKKLLTKNYLNDTEFTTWWIDQRLASRSPKGLKFIRIELRRKGVDPAIISQAIDGLDSDVEIHKAKGFRNKLLRKSSKLKNMSKPDQNRYLQKRLYARGFSSDTIRLTLS